LSWGVRLISLSVMSSSFIRVVVGTRIFYPLFFRAACVALEYCFLSCVNGTGLHPSPPIYSENMQILSGPYLLHPSLFSAPGRGWCAHAGAGPQASSRALWAPSLYSWSTASVNKKSLCKWPSQYFITKHTHAHTPTHTYNTHTDTQTHTQWELRLRPERSQDLLSGDGLTTECFCRHGSLKEEALSGERLSKLEKLGDGLVSLRGLKAASLP